MSESFPAPTSAIIPAYAYRQYSFDETVQAFFSSQNTLSQGYLNWFNDTPLALYTSPNIYGQLLDWIGQGVYGISRPVLASTTIIRTAGYNSVAYNTLPYDGLDYFESGTATIASDDIYKRVMTWNTYKGDGQVFCMQWLKNRLTRFINGIDGTDWPVLNNPVSVMVSGTVFTIQATSAQIYLTLAQCIANNVLALPFQYTFVVTSYLSDNGGVLMVASGADWPTTTAGLSTGDVWSNGGVAMVYGSTSPVSAPPVYFLQITAAELLTLTGTNLPLTNPGIGSLQLWNNGGVIEIA